MELEVPSRRGLRPSSRQIDRDLWLWFCRVRHCHENEGGPRISKRIVQEEAKRLFHCAGVTNFKASDGWYWRWLHRWRELDPSSMPGKGHQKPEKVDNKTAEVTSRKTVTAGTDPQLEVTLSSTMSKSSTPSAKDLESSIIRLDSIENCDVIGRNNPHDREQTIQPGNRMYQQENRLIETQYWTDYAESGALNCQDMMHLDKLTNDHFYGDESLNHAPQANQHNPMIENSNRPEQQLIQTLNSQQVEPQSRMPENDLDSGEIGEVDNLSNFALTFTNENTNLTGKFIRYDIGDSFSDIPTNETCLLSDNMHPENSNELRMLPDIQLQQLGQKASSSEGQHDLTLHNSNNNQSIVDSDLSCLMFDQNQQITAMEVSPSAHSSNNISFAMNHVNHNSHLQIQSNNNRNHDYGKLSDADGFTTHTSNGQMNHHISHLGSNYVMPTELGESTSQNVLSCPVIHQELSCDDQSLQATLETNKEVTSMYDVIASMTSSLLSSPDDLSEAFCMPNEQATYFGSKTDDQFREIQTKESSFGNDLSIDSIVDLGPCRDALDSRADSNLMDVVLDPLNSDGHQFIGSCDSGIDVSPMGTEENLGSTDFTNLVQNENNLYAAPYCGANPCHPDNFELSTGTVSSQPGVTSSDCNMLLNFNDDSVGIADLIPMSNNDDGDSIPEDYLEFIDSFTDYSSSQGEVILKESDTTEVLNDVPNTEENTQKCTKNPGADTIKTKRTGGERYLPYFKQRVLKYAASHTFKEAAARFHVHVDSITLWALRSRETTVKVTQQNPDKHLLLWLRRCRETGHKISGEQLRAKVRQLLNSTETGTPKSEENGWFYVWARRILNNNDDESDAKKDTTTKIATKANYPAAFKTEVALLAENTSKNHAALVFSVARKRVYEWLAGLRDVPEENSKGKVNTAEEGTEGGLDSNQGLPTHVAKNSSSLRPDRAVVQLKQRGREVTSSEVDKELLGWFHKCVSTTGRPTGLEVRSKAVELFRSHGHTEINCSHGWYRRWCTRHGLAIRHSGDEEVLVWCLQELDRGRNVSQRHLLTAAHSILSGKHKSDFKASAGWARRFAWRHGALFSRWPQLGQDAVLPPFLARRAATFRNRVQRLVTERRWPASVIGTMDEVPISLTSSGTGGRGTSLFHRPWPESVHATVILGCLANGELLPPAVVLKGEGEAEQVTTEKTTVLVFRQQNAAVDEVVLLQWLDFVWFRSSACETSAQPDFSERNANDSSTSPISDEDARSLLIMDSYEPHGSTRVRAALAARGSRLALIPAGCGSVLLPLAPAALRMFRTALEKEQRADKRPTSQPQLAAVATLVARAHASLASKKETLCRNFHGTGLIATDNPDEPMVGDLTSLT